MPEEAKFSTKRGKWAVLIGIEYYDHPAVEAATPRFGRGDKQITFKSLQGCVNDVLIMKTYLLNTIGVPPENIIMLLSHHPKHAILQTGEVYEEATYNNIVHKLKNMDFGGKKPARGDFVYIHYSGHGAITTTIFPDLKKEGNHVDEALVPCDITRGGHYLRDLELAALLEDLASTQGFVVTLVLDCCHSGGAIRGEEDDETETGLTRGIEDIYQSTPHDVKNCLEIESIRRWGRSSSTWIDEPKGYVVLTACLDNEKAKETTDYPQYGLLTAQLVRTLQDSPTDMTSQMLFDQVRSRVRRLNCSQTPDLIGSNERFFFGKETRQNTYAIRVCENVCMALPELERRITLSGGKLHGICVGDGYAVLVRDAELRGQVKLEDVLVKIVVEKVDKDNCSAKVRHIRGQARQWDKIKIGCPAILNKVRPEKKLTVRFVSRNTKKCGKLQGEKFRQLWTEKGGNLIWLDLAVEKNVCAFFTVHIDKKNNFSISGGDNLITRSMKQALNPLSAKNMADSMPKLILRLEHIARFKTTREVNVLSEMVTSRPLTASLKCAISCIPPERKMEDESHVRASEVKYDDKRQIWMINEGEAVQMSFENTGDRELYIVVLSWNPELSITKLYPKKNVRICETINAKQTKYVGFIPEIAHELKAAAAFQRPHNVKQPEIIDLHKVFVSDKWMDITAFELKSLKYVDAFGAKRDSSCITLEDLLQKLEGTRGNQQISFSEDSDEPATWGVIDLKVRVCPRKGSGDLTVAKDKTGDAGEEEEPEEEEPEVERQLMS